MSYIIRKLVRPTVFVNFVWVIVLTCKLAAYDAPPRPYPLYKPNQVKLSLLSSKGVYRVGELIKLKAFLENSSASQSYYVARTISGLFLTSPYHGVLVSILDSRNIDITIRAGGDPLVGKETIPIEEVEDYYIELTPGMIYGIADSYEFRLKPGVYRLTARYYEVAALKWPKDKLNSLSIPVLMEEVISNAITIKVI